MQLDAEARAQTLEPQQDPEEQREVGREHEPVLAHQLGTARDDAGQIEVGNTGEEVPLQPGLDIGAKLRRVDVGWRCGHREDAGRQAVQIAVPTAITSVSN